MSASSIIWKQSQIVLNSLSKFCLLKALAKSYFCERLKPIKVSAAVKGGDFIFPSHGHLFCPCFFPYSHTSVWAVNQIRVKTKPGRKRQIWGETTSLAEGGLPWDKCICGVHVTTSTLCCQLGGESCHKPLNP